MLKAGHELVSRLFVYLGPAFNMIAKNLLFLFLFFFMLHACFAQVSSTRFLLYEDSSKNLTAVEANALFHQKKFRPAHHFNNIGFTASVFWVMYQQVDNPGIDNYVHVGDHHINKISMYQADGTGIVQKFETGDHYPFTQRPLNTTGFYFPIKEAGNYLFRVDKSNESLQLTLNNESLLDILRTEKNRTLLLSILTGMMLLMTMFGVFLFMISRQKVYFLYVVYLVVGWLWVLSHSGFAFQYLWPDATWFASRSRPIFALGLGIATLFFMIEYVRAPKNKTTQHIVLAITALYSIFLMITIIAGDPSKARIWMYLLYILPLLSFVYVAFSLIFLFRQIRRKNKMAIFYLVGASILIVTSLMQSFLQLGQLTKLADFFTHIGMGLGFVTESIVITAGLVYSFNKYQKDKAALLVQINRQQEENTRALMEVQESERSRIADQLHDVAGSLLSAARINLSELRTSGAVAGESNFKKLMRSEEAVSEVSETVRTLSHALSPVMLKNVGIKSAIEKIAHLFSSENGTRIETSITGFESYEAELQPYYTAVHNIVYELLNNIVKHSNAKNALLQVTRLSGEINIIAEDNGTGTAAEMTKTFNTHGLQGIRLRVDYFKGEMSIDNNQPSGIITTIVLPL